MHRTWGIVSNRGNKKRKREFCATCNMHPTYGNVEHIDINVSPRCRSAIDIISTRPVGWPQKQPRNPLDKQFRKRLTGVDVLNIRKELKLRTYWNLATSSRFFFFIRVHYFVCHAMPCHAINECLKNNVTRNGQCDTRRGNKKNFVGK